MPEVGVFSFVSILTKRKKPKQKLFLIMECEGDPLANVTNNIYLHAAIA